MPTTTQRSHLQLLASSNQNDQWMSSNKYVAFSWIHWRRTYVQAERLFCERACELTACMRDAWDVAPTSFFPLFTHKIGCDRHRRLFLSQHTPFVLFPSFPPSFNSFALLFALFVRPFASTLTFGLVLFLLVARNSLMPNSSKCFFIWYIKLYFGRNYVRTRGGRRRTRRSTN